MKIAQASFVHAIEGPGERRTSYHFTDDKDPNIGFRLYWDEGLRAVKLVSNKTKQTYLVPFEQCRFIRLEGEVVAAAPVVQVAEVEVEKTKEVKEKKHGKATTGRA
jgi:hypothetical protein